MIEEAVNLNKLGNNYFNKGDFQQAIEFYTQAIERNNKVSTFFSNRGRAFRSIKKAEDSLRDAQEAIELDESNIKAHYLMGHFKSFKFVGFIQNKQRQSKGKNRSCKVEKSIRVLFESKTTKVGTRNRKDDLQSKKIIVFH